MNQFKSESFIVEDLKNKLTAVSQERDAAIEMWKLSEMVITNLREEMKVQMSLSKTDTLKKEMEAMQADYSEAIKLLESKLKSVEKELRVTYNNYSAAEEQVQSLKTRLSLIEEDKNDLVVKAKRIKEEKDTVEKELRLVQKRVEEEERMGLEARDKVRDALSLAQAALSNESSLLEEKERLEKKLNEVIDEFESRLESEIEGVKSSLSSRIDSLGNQLQAAISEKNKLALEYDKLKSECTLKLQEASFKYNNISQELSETRSRRMAEINEWSEEKKTFRKQILSLQSELENTLLELKQKEESSCENCSEMNEYLEKYRCLAKEWTETAGCVQCELEKFNSEIQKIKAGHKLVVKE